MTIIDFLTNEAQAAAAGRPHVSFHMPGHKGRIGIFEQAGYGDFARNMISCDITEIPGADALFCPESTLAAVMDNYAELYGARHTELLVNGSSAGIMAAVMGTVPIGGRLILGRNSHHSAFSAMRLGGINPVYVQPETDAETGLVSEISPAALESACSANPDASAVLITSPNYYGMMSDVMRLADIAHRHGMLLIVDQAHGAHLRFFDNEAVSARDAGSYIPYPRHAAESLGADIVVNSTHKTLLSLTGSGILNICTTRADISAITSMLRMLQTTSPSYLLMGSLDINERIMREHGNSIVKRWREDLVSFYRKAQQIPGLSVITGSAVRNSLKFQMYDHAAGPDPTKINLSMADSGINGSKLSDELARRGIISEMVHGDYVMMLTGAGSRSSDYAALLTALSDISDDYRSLGRSREGAASVSRTGQKGSSYRYSQDGYSGHLNSSDYTVTAGGAVYTAPPAADVPVEGEIIPLYKADGRVLYDPVTVYPPGTPLACPGEILDLSLISAIADAAESGARVTGITEDGMIKVGVQY